ncbi:MAG TPA: hypothetical protein VJ962_08140 [Clostridia bacterium]|nr:hypothetical protein [Clostridia bacterium]
MMKKIKFFSFIIVITLLFASCSPVSVKKDASNTKTTQDVLNEKIQEEEEGISKEEKVESLESLQSNTQSTAPEPKKVGSDFLDKDFIDLTELNKDMVYAMVYQMMVDPNRFKGKEVKMKGLFTVYYDEKTELNYFTVIIEDALACCTYGIEFILDDSSLVYPDDYPEIDSIITVTGTVETYFEEDNPYEYIRLKDSTLDSVE